MKFEDLKIIWDSKDNEQLFAFDKKSLHKHVENKSKKFHRRILIRDVIEIGACLVLVGWWGCLGLFRVLNSDQPWGDNWYLFVGLSLVSFVSSVLYFGRKRQTRTEAQHDNTMLGELNRHISQLDYQIRLIKNVAWWYFLPICVAVLLVFTLETANHNFPKWFTLYKWVVIVVSLLSIPIGSWVNHRTIRKEILPERRDFESLRDKLLNEQCRS